MRATFSPPSGEAMVATWKLLMAVETLVKTVS
jgi:hypothetical protein